jgi:Ca2+-binding RTX toxin-like protein
LIGGSANDTIWGQSSNDVLVAGGPGDDELMAQGGPTVYRGGSGIDMATYRNHPGGVTASIGDGANDGSPGEGDDVQGDIENLTGSSGDDTLTGSPGANVIEGLNGADALVGLAGTDTVAYRSILVNTPGGLQLTPRTAGVTVDIDGALGDDGSAADDQNAGGSRDTVAIDVEDLIGTQSDDTLIGDVDDNALDGGAGADALRGLGREDRLLGGDGDDSLDGGNGADLLNGLNGIDVANYGSRKSNQPVTATIDNVADDGGTIDDIDGNGPLTTRDDVRNSVENLRGGAGADSLTGNSLVNTLLGGPGADSFFGLGGDDVLRANDGIADAVINCGAGAADEAIEDAIDPAPIGCEL